MAGAVGKDIYWDTPSGQYSKCSNLCGSFPKACAEYCPDFRETKSQSSIVTHTAVQESWPFILIGVGVLALIPIVAVIYLKRDWLLGRSRQFRGVHRTTDPEDDQGSTLLPHNGDTIEQRFSVRSTDDSRSNDLDTSNGTSSSAEQVALVVKQPTAPPIEFINDAKSYPVQETQPATVQMDPDLIDAPLTNACNSQLQDLIRFGSTKPIQGNEVQPNRDVLPLGVGNNANCHPSNTVETESKSSFNNDVCETDTATAYSKMSQSIETLTQSIDLHCQLQMSETPSNEKLSESNETISQTHEATETLVIAPRELENVLSTGTIEESDNESHAIHNPASNIGAVRRTVDDSDQIIPDAESANSRADTAIDMTRSDTSLADAGPAEKQVMRPRYDREDSRQEVR